jgi:hypothetical protein
LKADRLVCFLCFCSLLSLLASIYGPAFADVVVCHVVDPAGTPVAGATVYLFDWDHIHTPAVTSTSASGAFTANVGSAANKSGGFENLCTIDAKGYAPCGGALAVGGNNRFQLSAPITVAGQVIDRNGKPVQGIAISALLASTSNSASSSSGMQRETILAIAPLNARYLAQTDTTGNFSISNLPADADIAIELTSPSYVNSIEIVPKGVMFAPAITAIPGTIIMGKIIRTDGKPEGGIFVNAQSGNTPPDPFSDFETSADGSYVITGLAPGVYMVTADPPVNLSGPTDWAAPAPIFVTASVNGFGIAPDLLLTGGGLAIGVVIDSNTKRPIQGATVEVQDLADRGRFPRTSTTLTDASGAYSLRVWAGESSLSVIDAPSEYVPPYPSKTIVIAEDKTTTVEPVELQPALTLTGIAVDRYGQPIPNLTIALTTAQITTNIMTTAPATTDSYGKFIIRALTPGTYLVDPGPDWSVISPLTLTAPQTAPVRILLKKSLTTFLQGTVVDSSGAPLPGVSICFTTLHPLINGRMATEQQIVTSRSDGLFTLPDAPPQPFRIQQTTFTKDGYVFKSGGQIKLTGDHLSISLVIMNRAGGD